MSNVDNIDRFGHCCLCHKNLIVRRVVDGKVQNTLSPEFDQTEFLMNNGSRLVVCLCKPCQSSNDLNDPKIYSNIMDACQKGWELEDALQVNQGTMTEDIAKENKEQRKDWYLELHSEGISQEQIEGRKKVVAEMIRVDAQNQQELIK